MAEIVRMPKLSDTMTEGVVAEWHKKVGDSIESGELLAEIETDKATMEFESFQEGVLLHIGVEKGQTAPVDSILAILGEKGEDIENLLNEDLASEVVEEPKKEKKEEVKVVKPEPAITAPVEVQPVIEKPVLTNTSFPTTWRIFSCPFVIDLDDIRISIQPLVNEMCFTIFRVKYVSVPMILLEHLLFTECICSVFIQCQIVLRHLEICFIEIFNNPDEYKV